MASSLQNVSTQDLYFICQMVDNVTRDPGSYIRHIEDIFGDASSAEIYDRLRQKLIFYDYQNRNLGNVGDDGCVCGDDIDLYHIMSFLETGLNNAFYGGNWWPHSVWPNPVPRN